MTARDIRMVNVSCLDIIYTERNEKSVKMTCRNW